MISVWAAMPKLVKEPKNVVRAGMRLGLIPNVFQDISFKCVLLAAERVGGENFEGNMPLRAVFGLRPKPFSFLYVDLLEVVGKPDGRVNTIS